MIGGREPWSSLNTNYAPKIGQILSFFAKVAKITLVPVIEVHLENTLL